MQNVPWNVQWGEAELKTLFFIPHCPDWGGSPPRSENPHRSSAVHWAVCYQQHLQIHTSGGRRQPLCGRNVSVEAEGSLAVSVRLGCVSTWEDDVMIRTRKCHWGQSSAQTKGEVNSHVSLELKLEEVVGDLGSTLTRKDEHLVPAYGYREVAARWRNLTTLIDLMDTKVEAAMLTHTGHCLCVW